MRRWYHLRKNVAYALLLFTSITIVKLISKSSIDKFPAVTNNNNDNIKKDDPSFVDGLTESVSLVRLDRFRRKAAASLLLTTSRNASKSSIIIAKPISTKTLAHKGTSQIIDEERTPKLSKSTGNNTVFISVKTTVKYHPTRVRDILNTWFTYAPLNIWFFSDADDAGTQRRTGNHLVNTKCSDNHFRTALCCKLNAEYDAFIASNSHWWCHFDDDNYVNVPQLEWVLGQYSSPKTADVYIGRKSTARPITVAVDHKMSSFWFGTGGAGVCLSRSLANKLIPHLALVENIVLPDLNCFGKLIQLGEKIRLPDDVTLGYASEVLMGVKLTEREEFHSHLESMPGISRKKLPRQVSLSAGSYQPSNLNLVDVPDLFDRKADKNRFLSLHCFLHPSAEICSKAGLPPSTTTKVL